MTFHGRSFSRGGTKAQLSRLRSFVNILSRSYKWQSRSMQRLRYKSMADTGVENPPSLVGPFFTARLPGDAANQMVLCLPISPTPIATLLIVRVQAT